MDLEGYRRLHLGRDFSKDSLIHVEKTSFQDGEGNRVYLSPHSPSQRHGRAPCMRVMNSHLTISLDWDRCMERKETRGKLKSER